MQGHIKCDLKEKGRRDEKYIASIKVSFVPNRGDELHLEDVEPNITGLYTVMGVKHHVLTQSGDHKVTLYVRKG